MQRALSEGALTESFTPAACAGVRALAPADCGTTKAHGARNSSGFGATHGFTVWPQRCVRKGMRSLNGSSLSLRHAWSVFLLILLAGPNAVAASATIEACCTSRELAFARYLASQQQLDPLGQSGPVAILIEASLPKYYKSARLLAVRERGQSQEGQRRILRIEGDGTVAEEVIDRYFALQEQIGQLAFSSVAITPINYKFHFAGEVKTGGTAAYIYDITPRKNRPGLLAGQLWMDSDTSHEVMLVGHLSDTPPIRECVDVVRETKLINGLPYGRVTHVSFTIPRLGRAELEITEVALNPVAMLPQTE
jgi:hypothetical protein